MTNILYSDLNTDINFEQRRSSVSISLSKLSVSKRISSPPNTPPAASKKDKKDKKDKHEDTSPVAPMRHPLAISLPGRTSTAGNLFGSSDAMKKDKHKRYHSENGVIPEEGPLSPTAPKGPPTMGGSAPLLVKVPPTSTSASSPSLHPRSIRGRTQSVSHDIGSLGTVSELQAPQSPEQVITLPTLPPGVTLPPLIDPMIKGFFIEGGLLKNHVGTKELVITDALKSEPWYTQYFWEKEHSNYIGTDDVLGVFVVSVTQDSQSNSAPASPQMSHLSASHDDLDLDEKKEWVRIRAVVRTKKVYHISYITGSRTNSLSG